MKRSAVVFVLLSLFIISSPSVSAGEGKMEDGNSGFFIPTTQIFDLDRDALPDKVGEPKAHPNLFKQIGSDFRNLFAAKENLYIAGAGHGAAWAASPYDEQITTSRFNSELFEGTTQDYLFEWGEIMGGSLVQVGGAFAALGIGKMNQNADIENLGCDLVRAQVLTQTLTMAIKLSVRRTRPDGSNNRAFPSGHASGTFATATVLQRRYGWKVGIPAYSFAAYVAASRLSENEHYLSDIIFGAAIGIIGGRTVTSGIGRARFAFSPMILPGGGTGIQATLLPIN